MTTILRIGRLKWSNIQFFYTIPRFEKIFEKNEVQEKKVYRKISVQGKKFSIVNSDGGPALKMDEIQGSSALELNKKMNKYLEGSYDISINSEVYIPPSKALAQTQFTQTLSLLVSNPATLSVLDPKKIVTMAAKNIDTEPDQWLQGDGTSVQDMQMLAEAENMIMAVGSPLAPTENATPEHTMVHLQYTKSADFLALTPEIQQLFELHILGEDANNPNTGGGPGALSIAPPGGNQTLEGQPGPSLNPETSQPQAQVADLQGANFNQ